MAAQADISGGNRNVRQVAPPFAARVMQSAGRDPCVWLFTLSYAFSRFLTLSHAFSRHADGVWHKYGPRSFPRLRRPGATGLPTNTNSKNHRRIETSAFPRRPASLGSTFPCPWRFHVAAKGDGTPTARPRSPRCTVITAFYWKKFRGRHRLIEVSGNAAGAGEPGRVGRPPGICDLGLKVHVNWCLFEHRRVTIQVQG